MLIISTKILVVARFMLPSCQDTRLRYLRDTRSIKKHLRIEVNRWFILFPLWESTQERAGKNARYLWKIHANIKNTGDDKIAIQMGKGVTEYSIVQFLLLYLF